MVENQSKGYGKQNAGKVQGGNDADGGKGLG